MYSAVIAAGESMMRIGRATDKANVTLGYTSSNTVAKTHDGPTQRQRGDATPNSETIFFQGSLDNPRTYIGNLRGTIHFVRKQSSQYQLQIYVGSSNTLTQDSISGIQTSRAFYSQSQCAATNGFGGGSGLYFWNWIPGQNGCSSTELFQNTTSNEHSVQGITHREKVIVVV